MLKQRMLPFVVWLAGLAAVPAVAQAPAIDVKTGLWEIATERSSKGLPPAPAAPQIPQDVLDKMPPSQRARIEAAMKAARGASGGSRVRQICMTAETLRRGPAFGPETRPSCRRTMRMHSRTAWEMQQRCMEGGRQQTVHVRYEAPAPDRIIGTVNVAMNDGKREIVMKQEMRGRWLGADCGTVKPR